MNGLPPEAETLVARIEGLLAQAEPLLARGDGCDEAGYALRETERRYLPDTLGAYLDIPPARRDAAAVTMLVEQLRLLERATAQRLAALTENAETALAANGAFLTERFGSLETLPDSAALEVEPVQTTPATLVRRFLARIETEAGPDPVALLERAAVGFTTAFPAISAVKRGGFLGRGPVEALALEVPRPSDLLRYVLARTAYGIEASVTRIVRGVALRTERYDVGEWAHALIEDLGAYVARERHARETLTRLFKETS
ncbi:MAG TPA: hypothetical protein VMA36_08665 [Candidatus Limnocylindria bacterium]|nr:hypothetical protein [Candidatus Limnocylindria bacterium]